MIEIKNISKKYKKDKKVIDKLNLKINDGEIFGFLGPNGAGKTTTIKMMTGILEIDEGDILIDNKSIIKDPIEAKKQMGLVPDNPDVFLKLKGIEYLNFVADVYDVSTEDRIKKIEELAEKFEIINVLNNKIESYSHGMRQKLIIIGTLLHNPRNWILDEPMTGLDPKSSFELKNIMREYANKNNTVFFSTHILDVAERLWDRIGIIEQGKLLFVGTYEDLKNELKEKKEYTIPENIYKKLKTDFSGYWTSEKDTKKTIHDLFEEEHVLIDPHTAVALNAMRNYKKETDDKRPCIVLSTASPYKFSKDVLNSIEKENNLDEFEAMERLANLSLCEIPANLKNLKNMEVRFTRSIEIKDGMQIIAKRMEELSDED